MAPGRPSLFTLEIASAICARLAQGESLRAICRDEGMPHESTVRGWALDNIDGFITQYTRARDIGLDSLADEVRDIADNGSADVPRDRLRFDARRWYLSKLAPKRYGDKVTQEVVGDPERPLVVTRIEIVAAGEHDKG